MQDQAKKLNRPRATAPVNSKLDKALVAYMAAAAAAMFTTSAQAKVVYTPANSSTTFGSIPIDLNNDGVVDFTISVIGGSFHSELTVVKPQVAGNAVLAAAKGGVAAGFLVSRLDRAKNSSRIRSTALAGACRWRMPGCMAAAPGSTAPLLMPPTVTSA